VTISTDKIHVSMTHYSLEDVAPEGVRELAHLVRLSIHPTINLQM